MKFIASYFSMPRIGLKIDCCLENLCSLEAPGEDFRWFLKINCGACGEVTDWVYVSQEEQIPVKGMIHTVWYFSKIAFSLEKSGLGLLE